MENIFTPRAASDSDQRVQMMLSDEDMAKIGRGKAWRATVTDLNTGVRYAVKGAPCNQPRCFCDAVIVEVLG